MENSANLVRYPEFLRDVEEESFTEEIERKTGDHLDYLREIMKIQKTWNFYLKRQFQSFDKNSRGCVTETQFVRVLNIYELLAQNPSYVRKLVEHYRRGIDVNYYKFLQDINELERSDKIPVVHT